MDLVSGEILPDGFHLFGGHIMDMAYSPDGQQLTAVDSSGTLHFCDCLTGAVWTASQAGQNAHCLAYASDRVLFAADRNKLLWRWDTDTRSVIGGPIPCRATVTAMARSPSGPVVACGTIDGSVLRFNSESGLPMKPWKGGTKQVMSLDYSPDGNCLASVGAEGNLRLWEDSGACLVVPLKDHPMKVHYSPSGSELLVAQELEVHRLNPQDGTYIGKFADKSGTVIFMDYGAEGRVVVTGGGKSVLQCWSGEGPELHPLPSMEVDF